jgi:hypothetical protein
MYVCMYVRMILSHHRSSNFISRTILTKLYTSVQYGKTSNKFAFHDAASKVKVTVTIFFNVCYRSCDFISQTILTKLQASVQYGTNEFAFHDALSKVKVTVTILENACYRSSYIPIAQNIKSRGFVLYAISCYCLSVFSTHYR